MTYLPVLIGQTIGGLFCYYFLHIQGMDWYVVGSAAALLSHWWQNRKATPDAAAGAG
jgi:hypothetical protein